MTGPVVVGVDGSEQSIVAVEAAAREAQLRESSLRVVHVLPPPALHPLPAQPELTQAAETLVADAVKCAQVVEPGLDVIPVVKVGETLPVLEDESHDAALIAVGNRGRNAFTGLLVGSTGVRLAAHAHCPVLVVRDRWDPSGPVVLGVDGSTAGEAAIDFAFEEASLRRVTLLAVHAWTPWNVEPPPPEDPSQPYAAKPGALAGQEERLLAEAVAGHCERYPDVAVERRAVRDNTREALIRASREAQLIVVGTRGRGGFTGLLLGSTSQAVMHHAHCTTAIVPPHR